MKRTRTPQYKRQIRALVIENKPVVCIGIITVLRETGRVEVVASADHSDDWIPLARKLAPDVVVVDIDSGGAARLEMVARLAAAGPRTAIVTLSEYDSSALREEAQRSGVTKFCNKSVPLEDLVETVLSAAKDGGGSREAVGSVSVGLPAASFTKEEKELLRRVAEGGTMKAIARAMRMDLRRACTLRERLMTRHGARGTAALTRLALAAGLVGTPYTDQKGTKVQ